MLSLIMFTALGCTCNTIQPMNNINPQNIHENGIFKSNKLLDINQKSIVLLAATYNIDNHSKVPFFKGKVLRFTTMLIKIKLMDCLK